MKACGRVEVKIHAFMSAINVHDVRESRRKTDLFIYLSYLNFFRSQMICVDILMFGTELDVSLRPS